MRTIRNQIMFALRQRATIFTFYILIAAVLTNFTLNVFAFQGRDLLDMYHPTQMLLLSYNRVYYKADFTLLLIQLYPVLVVCPAGFLLLAEKHRKEYTLIITRTGTTNYYAGKLIAGFATTALVFTMPFLLELLLHCISFPINAIGDFTEYSHYDPIYRGMVQKYWVPALFMYNPYLYTVAGILFFGVFSGILGMFTIALSAVLPLRYKIFTFLPVFLLLNLSSYLVQFVPQLPFSIQWYDYVLLFSNTTRSGGFFLAAMLVLLLVSLGSVFYKSAGDQL